MQLIHIGDPQFSTPMETVWEVVLRMARQEQDSLRKLKQLANAQPPYCHEAGDYLPTRSSNAAPASSKQNVPKPRAFMNPAK